jgi:hypothetical protein
MQSDFFDYGAQNQEGCTPERGWEPLPPHQSTPEAFFRRPHYVGDMEKELVRLHRAVMLLTAGRQTEANLALRGRDEFA